ncbi:MAG TPA: hypothetical protein P5254_16460 [Aquihabitans sp.]|nr:hypothetical protein [Aquihabitans sp.]
MANAGTIRTATEDRLVELIAALDDFSAVPTPGKWLVSPPPNTVPQARRWVVIGTPDGQIDPNGLERSHNPQIDVWSIACGLACTDIADPQEGKQACEDALNAIADLLASDHRLGLGATGPREVQVTSIDGPYSAQEQGKPRLSWLNFDISCTADIRRNP